MPINKFETRINFLTAIKNLDICKISNVTKNGDFEIICKSSSILVEVKAAGTSGKNIKIGCSITTGAAAAEQLSKNVDIYDWKVVYITNLKDSKAINITTNNITKDVKSAPSIGKTRVSRSSNYKNIYKDIKIMQYSNNKNDSYIDTIKKIKAEIKAEMNTKLGFWDKKVFNFYERMLLQDLEAGIVVDRQNIKLLNKSLEHKDIKEICAFGSLMGRKILEDEIYEILSRISDDDFDLISYRGAMTDDDFYKFLLDEKIDEEVALFLTYFSRKGVINENNHK